MTDDAPILYTCSDAGSSGSGGCRHSGPCRIDMHCHIQIPAADAVAQPHFKPEFEPFIKFSSDATREVNKVQIAGLKEKMVSVDLRLEEMDRTGVDMQVLSPSPSQYHYWAEPELARDTAKLVNNAIAETVGAHPKRFSGLGTIPLQHPEFALAELNRLINDCGLKGIEIGTNVNGTNLSAAELRPIFARAEELGALIFLHPSGFTDGARLAEHYLINTIGNPLESTIAVSHLIFGGVLKELPDLKILVAHGGGFLPTYAGRMDHAYHARSDCRQHIDQSPTHYLRKLYFDSVVYEHQHLEHLVQMYGADHVIMGTDYPYDMAEADPAGFINSAPNLSDAEKAMILGGNAARLLGLPQA